MIPATISDEIEIVLASGTAIRIATGTDVRVKAPGHQARTGRVSGVRRHGDETRVRVLLYYRSRCRWGSAAHWYDAGEIVGVGWDAGP